MATEETVAVGFVELRFKDRYKRKLSEAKSTVDAFQKKLKREGPSGFAAWDRAAVKFQQSLSSSIDKADQRWGAFVNDIIKDAGIAKTGIGHLTKQTKQAGDAAERASNQYRRMGMSAEKVGTTSLGGRSSRRGRGSRGGRGGQAGSATITAGARGVEDFIQVLNQGLGPALRASANNVSFMFGLMGMGVTGVVLSIIMNLLPSIFDLDKAAKDLVGWLETNLPIVASLWEGMFRDEQIKKAAGIAKNRIEQLQSAMRSSIKLEGDQNALNKLIPPDLETRLSQVTSLMSNLKRELIQISKIPDQNERRGQEVLVLNKINKLLLREKSLKVAIDNNAKVKSGEQQLEKVAENSIKKQEARRKANVAATINAFKEQTGLDLTINEFLVAKGRQVLSSSEAEAFAERDRKNKDDKIRLNTRLDLGLSSDAGLKRREKRTQIRERLGDPGMDPSFGRGRGIIQGLEKVIDEIKDAIFGRKEEGELIGQAIAQAQAKVDKIKPRERNRSPIFEDALSRINRIQKESLTKVDPMQAKHLEEFIKTRESLERIEKKEGGMPP